MSTSPSSRKGLLAALSLIVVAAIAVTGWLAFTGTKKVPDATFTLLSGKNVSTGDLKGKVYLVNFWATNCDTCMHEMPQMISTFNQFKQNGLEFVAVAMNYDNRGYVENYTKSRALPFQVAYDSTGSASKAFGNVQLTPTTFLIDREGHILKRYVGEPSFTELHQLIEKALSVQS